MNDSCATCLYCGESKSLAMFNREHVLPQSFGTFPDNPVLRDLVCEACNTYFSRDLELRLGRDSAEGLERFRNGIVAPKKRGSIGRHIEIRYRGGRLDGAILEWQVGSDGRELQVHPVPQIGFSTSPNGPFEWHRVGELPSGDVLRERGFKIDSTYFLSGGLSKEEVVRYVEGLGYKLVEQPAECETGVDAEGMVPLMVSGTIDQIIVRAVAKIAFNYFAFHYPSVASMDQFNSIRRYIRHGERPPVGLVTLLQESAWGLSVSPIGRCSSSRIRKYGVHRQPNRTLAAQQAAGADVARRLRHTPDPR
jgi:hypothetical protein